MTAKISEGGWQGNHSAPFSPLKLFDHVTENEITLKNTGKVGFEFRVLTDPQSSPDNLLPGVPLIQPLSVSTSHPPMTATDHGRRGPNSNLQATP